MNSQGADMTGWWGRGRLIMHRKSNQSTFNAQNLESLAFYNILITTSIYFLWGTVRFGSFLWSTDTSRILDQTSLSLEYLLQWFQCLRNQDGAGACPVLRTEQLITPKSLLSTACGRSWTELYYNKGRYKQCQISSAAITMIGPESRGWSPHGVMAHGVDTERRECTSNSCVLLWDRENNYLYHLAYSLFDNSLTCTEVTDCSVELLRYKLQQREY